MNASPKRTFSAGASSTPESAPSMVLSKRIILGRIFGRRSLFVAASMLAASTPLAATAAESTKVRNEPKTVVYRGATLIDGTDASPRRNMAIVVDGERIRSVLPAANLPSELLKSAHLVEVAGLYVIPGLIDSHVHIAAGSKRTDQEVEMRRYLYSGITTVRDMAGDGRALADLARSALLNEIAAPDLFYAGFLAGPSFYKAPVHVDPRTTVSSLGGVPGRVPWMQEVTEASELPVTIGVARGTGATGIKIYADLVPSLVQKITREGHRQGLRVWSHFATFPTTPLEVVNAGVDGVSHICLLAYQGSRARPDRYHSFTQPDIPAPKAEIDAVFRAMARNGTVLEPVLRVYWAGEERGYKNPYFPFYCPTSYAYELTRAAFEAGVPIAAGTDGTTPVADDYPALHEEMDLLAKGVGMPPIDVIRAATVNGAKLLGMEKDLGTIEPGKYANLVFLAADPLESIGNLRTVKLTVKRGASYPRSDFKKAGP